MSRSITFIHAADLHLGAPFKGLRNLSAQWADLLVESIPVTLQRIVDLALEDQVDFVVFAGDTFDASEPSYADFALFVQGMRQLEEAGIKVYVCAGNHDPLDRARSHYGLLPSNVTVFPSEHPDVAVYERDGQPLALVAGRSYGIGASHDAFAAGMSRDELIAQCGAPSDVPFAVGVLHTGLDVDLTRTPVSRQELLSMGLDYWACGHIHLPRLYPETNARIAFSGSPQGRASSETGDHGVLEVTLVEGAPNETRFVPVAQVAWEKLEVDVSECATVQMIEEEVRTQQFAQSAHLHAPYMVCSVALVGRSPLHDRLDAVLLESLRVALNSSHARFFIDSIEDRTRPLARTAPVEGLFSAEYKQVVGLRRGSPELLDQARRDVAQEFSRRGMRPPTALDGSFSQAASSASSLTLLGLLDEAEELVADLLAGEELAALVEEANWSVAAAAPNITVSSDSHEEASDV